MPPKSAAAVARHRQSSAASPASIARVNLKSNSQTPLAATSAAGSAPPSTVPFTSSERSTKVLSSTSPAIKSYSPDLSTAPTPLPRSLFGNSVEPVTRNFELVKSVDTGINCACNENSIKFVEPEKACSLEDETFRGSEYGVTNEHILTRGQDERSFAAAAVLDTQGSGVAVPGYGKKKIVKRTVRVVRRVIKKRVPKRVLMDGKENRENCVVLSEKSDNLNLRNYVVKKSNLVSDVVENCALVNEMNSKSIMADDVEPSSFNIDGTVSEPALDKRGNDLVEIDFVEMHKLKDDLVEVEKINADAETVGKSERTNLMEDLIVENMKFTGEIAKQSGSTKGVDAFMMDNALEENWSLDEAKDGDVDHVIDQMASLVEETCVGLSADGDETLMGKTGGDESKNAPFNEGLLLSGELEALERRKRRKTEIFVGGLNKDAKEDHIWKAFEGAGEIVQVRLAMNTKTGKNKGFAFIRFAAASDAKNALEKYSKVEICGSQCDAAPVEGNDTIFLGNIDRKWKSEDVVRFLEKAGINRIEVVTLKADPRNMEKNRGFAFVEFETNKDAQIAFHKLKKKDVFGKGMKIKIAWAQPLTEPSEEEILNVKSVYAEYLPPSWDEEKVKEYFKIFGEIENVVLAKDLASSKRKDFAFINYSTRDAAVACIEAISRQKTDSKVKMAVSLANPITKSKQLKVASDSARKQFSLENPKVLQATMKHREPRSTGKAAISNYDVDKTGSTSSTTDELVQILRQQALSKHILQPPITGTSVSYNVPVHGGKRPLSHGGHDQHYLDSRALPRARFESYSISDSSALSHGIGANSFPYHHEGSGYTSESLVAGRIHPRLFQTREHAPYLWRH